MSGQPRSGFSTRGPPLGIKLFQKILPSTSIVKKNIWYRGVVLLLTFWSYVNYHATRKTLSVVKNTLIQNCTDGSVNVNGVSPCAWEPFDGPDAKALLGTLDSAFLFSYAFFMFISGMLAEQVNLRYYISIGMILSGISTYAFGLAKVYNIHMMGFFIAVQVFGGIAQTTGWPGVVTVMGHWFGKGKRVKIRSEGSPILSNPENQEKPAIGFIGALKIPGVLEFSFCLFFAKLVNYTFLYWLPGYIKYSTSLSNTLSGDLATVFDIGGIFGGIAAGLISDMTGKSASVCATMLVLSIPMLFIYQLLGATSLTMSIVLLLLLGSLVNGPYALITTAVSAELGTHECLEGNSKALATVTSIIDGTGSIGAAVGPLLAGFVSSYGWIYVFYMLMISCSLAVLLLVRLLVNECKQISKRSPDPTRTL
ncbi:hypothetical protein M8J76_008993 [Diaphorina citri]|nr:hypothetical protein M8J76_008993 [Diaphorina citri]